MGRMSGMKEALDALLASVGVSLPPWVAPVVALAIFSLLFPAMRRNHHTGLARKRIQAAGHERHEERQRLQAEALALVGAHPMGLVAVAEEALRREQRKLAREAVARRRATGRKRRELKKLESELDGRGAATSEAEALAIERLLRQEGPEAARARLLAARQRWPRAEALREVAAQLDEAQ